MDKLLERIDTVCGAMAGGPRPLRAYLEKPGPDFTEANPAEVDQAIDLLLADDPNTPSRLRFSAMLRTWDNLKGADWAAATPRNSAERRARIHELLSSDSRLAERIDALLPYYHLDDPLIIADRHEDWYEPQSGVRDYYWRTYARYLQERRGWDESAILSMDNHTRAIVECLANPEAPTAYASRGLVMGYVQSGKTANFTGVVARAADAGYRLIIVLAGTWNILRNQTQRRFDKELLGKELLKNDDSYTAQKPSDWGEFLEHGTNPEELGQYSWQRLTRPDIDFRRLKAAIDHLEFEKHEKALPLYDPRNLHRLPVKLLVIKKNSAIIGHLVKDLGQLRTKLTELPTLIIDDESDQAGLNTIDPRRVAQGAKARSKTNGRIVDLLKLFPRGQYVGYTATPYANAVVDPNDPEDLYPNDFIIPLDRPPGYMGISDFFDPESVFADLDKGDFSLPEIALIRRVESALGADDKDLQASLRAYVLSGALKLYRQRTDPERYRAEYFKHHTMLVHTSPLKGEMASNATRIRQLWDDCALNSPKGLAALEHLWNTDYKTVCERRGNELTPPAFRQLLPDLSEAIKRIEKGREVYLVVNSDSVDAPDFSAAPVWKIIIGGNKLSRGYTIEGLTISYYRRVAGTADTLMQMGRWFGFRPGYSDLVRVFLGVREGRKGDVDLVSLFKAICRMEERFRDDIARYVRAAGKNRITPRDVPPLISIAGALPPTARNKMFNAVVTRKNFGGATAMPIQTSATPAGLLNNLQITSAMLASSRWIGTRDLGGTTNAGKRVAATAVLFEASTKAIGKFLRSYRWLEPDYKENERPTDINLQLEFLEKEKHGIKSWLIVAPQRRESFGKPIIVEGAGSMTVKERHRDNGRGFQVFGEPSHRTIAECLCGISTSKTTLARADKDTRALHDPSRAVMLLYPVREEEESDVSVGFELLYPPNDLAWDVSLTVIRKAEQERAIVKRK